MMISILKKLMTGILLVFVCVGAPVVAEGWKVVHNLSAIDGDIDGATFQLELRVSWDHESTCKTTAEAMEALNLGECVGDAGIAYTINFEDDRVFEHYSILDEGDDAELEFAWQRLGMLSVLPGRVLSVLFQGLYVLGVQEIANLKEMLNGWALLQYVAYHKCMLREFVSGVAREVCIKKCDFYIFQPTESVCEITFEKGAFSSVGQHIIDDVAKVTHLAEPILQRFGLKESVFAGVDFKDLLERGVELRGTKHVPQSNEARWRSENPSPPVRGGGQAPQPHPITAHIPGVPPGVEIDLETWRALDVPTRDAIVRSMQGDIAEQAHQEQRRKEEQLRAHTLGDHAGWRVDLRLKEPQRDGQLPTINCTLMRGCFNDGSSSRFTPETVVASTADRGVAEEIARLVSGREYTIVFNTQDTPLYLYNQVAQLPCDEQDAFFRNRLGIFTSLPEGLDTVVFGDATLLAPREIEFVEEALARRASIKQIFYGSGSCFYRPMAFGERPYKAHIFQQAFFCSYDGELSSKAVDLSVVPAGYVPETIANLFALNKVHEEEAAGVNFADINFDEVYAAFGVVPTDPCLDLDHIARLVHTARASSVVSGSSGDDEEIPPLDIAGEVGQLSVAPFALNFQGKGPVQVNNEDSGREPRPTILGSLPGGLRESHLSAICAEISFEGDNPFPRYAQAQHNRLGMEWNYRLRFGKFSFLRKNTAELIIDNLIALSPDEIIVLEKHLDPLKDLHSITFKNCVLLRPLKSSADKVIFLNTAVCQPFTEDYRPEVEWRGKTCELEGKGVLPEFLPFVARNSPIDACGLQAILDSFGIALFLTREEVVSNAMPQPQITRSPGASLLLAAAAATRLPAAVTRRPQRLPADDYDDAAVGTSGMCQGTVVPGEDDEDEMSDGWLQSNGEPEVAARE